MANYNKEIYEKLIDSSQLFFLDKEKEHNAYKREALKMIENLYNYLMAVSETKYEHYGVEIVETARKCIENYNSSSGRFLNYFMAAISSECSHSFSNEALEEKYHGIKLTEQEKRDIRKYKRLFSKVGHFQSKEEQYTKIAECMNLSVEQVKKVAEIDELTVTGEYSCDSDGEEISIVAQKADDFLLEEYFDNLSSLLEVLDKIQTLFDGLQERQKPIVSDMLTIKIGLDIYEIERISRDYSFISKDISRIIKETGCVPTQREIADKYQKNEASISRTMKEFLIKLKGEV